MDQSQDLPSGPIELVPDSALVQEIEQLHRLSVYGRWLVVCLLWLTVGTLSLWNLRSAIQLLLDYFTWAAVRYGIIYNRLPSLGLIFCIAMTVSVLVWQTRNILWGRPRREQKRLEQQVLRIRQQGPSHPLWKFVRGAAPIRN
ncbi:FIG00870315: hypothetical protein [uncultured Synechococcales cyanobacterium]|uniref:Uncharacterized protein n=1 Tax=uncultured Synechococcales cyanobacterium TaxID=1936017 RepID=A0A6J4V0M7_9CYAN|nr:FIG00870315: hypothetical protein [uncultured Synechococcales cyanobacterium]